MTKKITDPWEAAIQRYMAHGLSRKDAAQRVNADVFGEESAEEMRKESATMEGQVVKAAHHEQCSELAPGDWECHPECPVYTRKAIEEAKARRWRWGSVE
jgi:hypothetical protein